MAGRNVRSRRGAWLGVVLAATAAAFAYACEEPFEVQEQVGDFVVSIVKVAGPDTLVVADQQTFTVEVRDAQGREVLDPPLSWSEASSGLLSLAEPATGTSLDVTGADLGEGVFEVSLTNTRPFSDATLTDSVTVVLGGVDVTGAVQDSTTLTALADTVVLRAGGLDAVGGVVTGSGVTWSLRGQGVVTLEAFPDGDSARVIADARGEETVQVTHGACSGQCTDTVRVRVSPVITAATLAPQSDTALVGDTVVLAVEGRDSRGNLITDAAFTWLSLDPTVASVDTAGMVVAVDSGTVTVVATAPSGAADSASVLVPATGSMEIQIADAPADFLDKAWLYTSGVYVVDTLVTRARRYLSREPQAFDLLTLRDGVTVTAGTRTVPAGTFGGVHLELDSAVVELAAGYRFGDGTTSRNLPLPSEITDSLSVDVSNGAVVAHGGTVQVVVEFDVNRNFPFDAEPGTDSVVSGVSFQARARALDRARAGAIRGSISVPGGLDVTRLTLEAGRTDGGRDTLTAGVGTDRTYEFFHVDPGNYGVRFLSVPECHVPSPLERAVAVTIADTIRAVDFALDSVVLARIELTPALDTLHAIGDTLTLTGVARDAADAEVAGVGIRYASDAEPVATAESDGSVVARGNGTAQITASSCGLSATSTVVVQQVAAEIRFTDPESGSVALSPDDTYQLAAEVADSNGVTMPNASVTWSSSDTAIVTVDAAGLLTARVLGTALITAQSGLASGTVAVTVRCKDTDIATFEDANLEAAIRAAVGIGAQDDLTCGLISGLTELSDDDSGIASLVGIQNLTSLTTLAITHNAISDIGPLSGLPSLRSLNLHGNAISDISALSELTSLTSLAVDENSISDISALSGLTSLTELLLGNNSIVGISALSGLTSLRTLTLDNNSISDISVLSGLTSLTDLYLWGNSITDISALSGLTSLGSLELHDNSITDISALSGLGSLTFLELSGNANLSNIQPLLDNTGLGAGDQVHLRSTSVSCTDVAALQAKGVTVTSDCALLPTELCTDHPDAAIGTFEDANLEVAIRAALSVGAQDDLSCGLLRTLTNLTADSAGIGSLVGIQNLTSLTSLDLFSNSITDISALSGLTSLTFLNFDQNSISVISALGGLTSLTTLYLGGNNSITDVTPLSGLTSLRTLSVGTNLVSDISPLSSLTSLTFLALDNNTITDISVLSGLTNLEYLDLNSNSISVISPLSGLTSLTTLYLGSNSISVISPLSGLTSLTLLYLQNNSITDISALSGLTSLTDLRLFSNSISVISALSGLTSLEILGLSSNSISDISALSGLTSLTFLHLGTNSISDVSALSGLTSLTDLYLQNNSISDISALSGLTSLEILGLGGNANLSNIQPLLDNTGLGPGDQVFVRNTNVSCTDVAALQAKGVTVTSDCVAQGDTWDTTKAPRSTAALASTAGVIDGILYVVGGQIAGGFATDTVEAYDPVSDTWTTKAPIPFHEGTFSRQDNGRGYAASGVINGKLYVVGGGNPGDISQVDIYDPVTNSWSTASQPMPSPRSGVGAGVIDDILYVVGGDVFGQNGSENILRAYNPVTDTWVLKASMPTARQRMAVGVIDGKLYVAGGFSTCCVPLATFEVYDPVSDTWTTAAPLPEGKDFPAGGVIDGKFYALTGVTSGPTSANVNTNATFEYDPTTDAWASRSPIPTARSSASAGVIAGKLYVVGGSDSVSRFAVLEVYTPPTVATSIQR